MQFERWVQLKHGAALDMNAHLVSETQVHHLVSLRLESTVSHWLWIFP